MSKEIGRPAFPVPGLDRNLYNNGMTLRDYFAAKAMQGFCTTLSDQGGEPYWDVLATDAYRQADAMMKARNA